MERIAAVSCVMGIASAVVKGGREISRLARRSITTSTCDLRAAVSPSPWLMLRPLRKFFGKDHLTLRFYTFEDKKEIAKLKVAGGDEGSDLDRPNYVGASHGWLAAYHRHKRTMFLSHPVHRLSLDFPTLADTPSSGEDVSSVAFSPPNHTDCRALMIYGPDRRLALAALACSGCRWKRMSMRKYETVVYSSRRGTFFCLTKGEDDRLALESWDVSNADSPRIDWTLDNLPILEDPSYKKGEYLNIYYLVFDEEAEGHLYLVVRRALVRNLPCGAYNPSNMHYTDYRVRWGHAHKTVDFVVYKIDIERKEVSCMINSLDGLALFVGVNQPVAVRVRSSQLQPNAIYFTELPEFATIYYCSHDIGDNGIFSYESKIVSPFLHSYPVDVRSACLRELVSLPLPLWYHNVTSPSPLV